MDLIVEILVPIELQTRCPTALAGVVLAELTSLRHYAIIAGSLTIFTVSKFGSKPGLVAPVTFNIGVGGCVRQNGIGREPVGETELEIGIKSERSLVLFHAAVFNLVENIEVVRMIEALVFTIIIVFAFLVIGRDSTA